MMHTCLPPKRRLLSALATTACLIGWCAPTSAATVPYIVGGDQGVAWKSEGVPGTATVILTASAVDAGQNNPGGVVNFEHPDRPGWIFPTQADTSDNILIGVDDAARGGRVYTPLPSFSFLETLFKNMHDEDGNTALVLEAETSGESAFARGFIVDFDLGAIFGVNRIRFFPRNGAEDYPSVFANQREFIKGYELFLNDGAEENQRNDKPIWETVAIDGQNEEADVDLRFPTRFVRFIRIESLSQAGFEIAEFQVFSEGFVPSALYLSNVFDFGEKAILGNLRYIHEKIGDATRSEVRIRTRAGSDPDPVEYSRIGLQESGRVVRRGDDFEPVPIDALWKKSGAVDDDDLKALIDTLLDDSSRDGREVLLDFGKLPIEDRLQITLQREDYFGLEDGERSAIRDDLTNWDAWSPAYPLEAVVQAEEDLTDPTKGISVLSSGGRRYFQFMVEFENETFDAASGIGGLAFDVTTPVFADSLVAEIFPRAASVGEETDFTYAVLFKSTGAEAGFDQLEIQTPLRTESIARIQITAPDGSVQETDLTGQSLEALPVTKEGFTVEESNADGFAISFPRISADSTLLKVEFKSAVLRVGTRFSGRAVSTDDPLFGQPVLAGNAAVLDPEDPDDTQVGTPDPRNLFVEVPVADELLTNVGVVPTVFTPNGDGTNDTAQITYDITNIARDTEVTVEVFDLSGRLVRSHSEDRSSGRFTWRWGGEGAGNELVPPGNYLFVVTLYAGTGQEKAAGVVAVAY